MCRAHQRNDGKREWEVKPRDAGVPYRAAEREWKRGTERGSLGSLRWLKAATEQA